MILVFVAVAVTLAALSAVLFVRNLYLYVAPPDVRDEESLSVSVLIPARNEEANIAAAVESVLASRAAELEVLVGDDNSEDQTAAIVCGLAAADPRVRLVCIPPLPAGWNGKQHACWVLANTAKAPVLCFLDADVRVTPDALARALVFLRSSHSALVSGVPRQITGSWLEKLVLPLIHFLLLGYLPLDGMRRSSSPAYAAGCGQLMLALTYEYLRVGGHSAIKTSRHDGLTLPAAFRRAGCKTDLFDATAFSSCRMYASASEVWNGLAKNATEGLATPVRLPVFTVLLVGGHVLPFAILVVGVFRHNALLTSLSAMAVCLSLLPRLIAVRRFRQPLGFALLHPLGIVVLLSIQLFALLQNVLGKPASWKGRAYPAAENEAERQAPALAKSKKQVA